MNGTRAIYEHSYCFSWWSQGGLNSRPPACKAGALPTELWPLRISVTGRSGRPRSGIDLVKSQVFCPLELRTCYWWVPRDSNPQCLPGGTRFTVWRRTTHRARTPLNSLPCFGEIMYGWQGRTRTDMQLINSESAYQMAHMPGNWSRRLDSNQWHLASKARTLTRLSYTEN